MKAVFSVDELNELESLGGDFEIPAIDDLKMIDIMKDFLKQVIQYT